MTDQHGEREAGPSQDDFDSVPEHLEGEAAAGSLLAAHPVRTHLDLPTDGSVAVGLYMTHTTERLYGTAKAIQAIRQVGLAWATAQPGTRHRHRRHQQARWRTDQRPRVASEGHRP